MTKSIRSSKRELIAENFNGFAVYGTFTKPVRPWGKQRVLIEIEQPGKSFRLYECIAHVHGVKIHFEKH
jgi:hypothetical protein